MKKMEGKKKKKKEILWLCRIIGNQTFNCYLLSNYCWLPLPCPHSIFSFFFSISNAFLGLKRLPVTAGVACKLQNIVSRIIWKQVSTENKQLENKENMKTGVEYCFFFFLIKTNLKNTPPHHQLRNNCFWLSYTNLSPSFPNHS